ncbi:hypothetical protein PACTADRAFT_42729 [Pachysolen tannophilus NRRL Y-2460]|uniref:Cystathionine gamma-synthase n=1 Tax=Pachysolen tannophilus NRRL Y-2460 TaxID=669874 RepID=A0A1E4TTV8_PACTA|nr:hypothetical protein PACTADRAFT_42729 [Pachysolen tannophilus NRRL Y-2460]
MASDNLALNDDNSNNKQQQQQQQQQQQRHQRQQSRQNTGNSNTPINTNIILDNFSYSRTSHPNSEKVEKILENITNGYVTLYNSGTSAIMGLLTYLNPNKICINNNGGYQGTHQVIKLLSKLTHLEKLSLNEYNKLRKGDVMLIESPMNPEGYCVDIEKYSKLAHSKNALLLVDSTLAPPPLQDPFKHGADYIIHSATKYFSGHSDLLAGFIVSSTKDTKINLLEERFSLGTNIANFDSFLLLRSLRTFKMRILQQSSNTFQLIKFLMKNISKYPIITKIHHSSLQLDPFVLLQLNGYYNPIFAIEFKSMEIAELLINRFSFLNCKNNLTGGGVETTVELTYKNPNFVNLDFDNINSSVGANLLRFSVGCEDHEDLINDFDQALSSFNT